MNRLLWCAPPEAKAVWLPKKTSALKALVHEVIEAGLLHQNQVEPPSHREASHSSRQARQETGQYKPQIGCSRLGRYALNLFLTFLPGVLRVLTVQLPGVEVVG